jgi:chromosome segregation ATPase
MATISSISGAQTAPQSSFLQLQLLQAARDAAQAEQVARSLQAEVSAAQQAAASAEQNVRGITAQARQAEVAAGQAQSNLAAVRSVGQVQAQQASALSVQAQTLNVLEPVIKSRSSAPPIVNTQGQITGTVVNTTA